MDLMAIRRGLMAAEYKKDYLKSIEWDRNKYIAANGKITAGDGSAAYSIVPLFLKAGAYRLQGYNRYTVKILNYRIHEYNSNDEWVKQVTYFPIDTQSPVDATFVLDHDSYIRISMAIQYFTGTLTKSS